MSKIHRIPLLGTALAFRSPVSVAQDRHGSALHSQRMNGKAMFDSQLFAKVINNPDFRLMDGRVVKTKDLDKYSPEELVGKELIEGTGRERAPHEYFGNRKDASRLSGRLYNRLIKAWYWALYRNKTLLDLGSGLTTNVAALATASEAVALASPSAARINLLFLANAHATGTGATAAAATDIKLTTNDAITAVAGAQTLISAANSQKYQTVATLTGYGTEAVVEWGLHTSITLSATTGTPFTATSGVSGTVTGTPLTASSTTVQGLQQNIVVAGTTTVWGFITSNSTSVITIPAWYKTADGTAGSTPGSTEAFTLRPILYDHKVFSAINTVSGDTIQFTYQLTIASGN